MTPTYSFNGQVAPVAVAGSGMGSPPHTPAQPSCSPTSTKTHSISATEALTAAGHQATAVTCDVADEAHVAAIIDRTVETLGQPDIAFNNAGIVGLPPATWPTSWRSP